MFVIARQLRGKYLQTLPAEHPVWLQRPLRRAACPRQCPCCLPCPRSAAAARCVAPRLHWGRLLCPAWHHHPGRIPFPPSCRNARLLKNDVLASLLGWVPELPGCWLGQRPGASSPCRRRSRGGAEQLRRPSRRGERHLSPGSPLVAAGSDGCCFLFQGWPGGSSGVLQRGLRADKLQSAGQHPLLAPRSSVAVPEGLKHPVVLSRVGQAHASSFGKLTHLCCSCSAPVIRKRSGFLLQSPRLQHRAVAV